MKAFKPIHLWSPSALLNAFIYGSLSILLLCLFFAALFFSETYLLKEKARQSDSSELISHYFESQYRGISEEMWTRNFDAIHMRISSIASRIGRANYDLILLDENKSCVFQGVDQTTMPVDTCEIPSALRAQILGFQSQSHRASLQFDYQAERYVYMAPLYVGPILKGYIYVSLSDPYEFYRESSILFVMRMFALPIFCILLVWLAWLVVSHRLILKPYLARMVDLERKQAVAELAGRVAHNIQSPLVVVKSVGRNIRGFDETQRRLLISAANRIEKIANHLISQFTTQKMNLDSDSFCFLWPVLDSSVAEKMEVLGTRSSIEINYHLSDDLYCSGVPIPSEEMAAIFSNIINNAIEAFDVESKQNHKIDISVGTIETNRIRISISDNGTGIEPGILDKLRKEGGSFGKAKGVGIGLLHAKEILGKVGGSLSIESDPRKGTRISLEIPIAPAPSWCPKALDLSSAKSVVVLDDDPSVHLLWRERLSQVSAFYLTDPTQLDMSRHRSDETFFILDYEIIGSETTGLDLISRYELGDRAVLVTSYFNEPEIQRAVEALGTKMLPKFMINRVPIDVGSAPSNPLKSQYDVILIDDDVMVHELWNFEALQRGKRLKTAQSFSDLNLEGLSKATPIFVDKNLAGGASGIHLARVLFEAGFLNISLTSGEKISRTEVPDFIRSVANKNFPDSLPNSS